MTDNINKILGAQRGVAKIYWMERRGFTIQEYLEVMEYCSADQFGFCEDCMGNRCCEIAIKGAFDESI